MNFINKEKIAQIKRKQITKEKNCSNKIKSL